MNELFVRVPFIRDFSLSQMHGAGNPVRSPIAGEVQGAVMLVFVAMLVWFAVRVALNRRPARPPGK
jgi:hypothetical protein